MSANESARPGLVQRFQTRASRLLRHGFNRATKDVSGRRQKRAILIFAAVLALDSADKATIGASATQLRSALDISNTDIGLLITITSAVGAIATIGVGVLVDRTVRTNLLAGAVALWGVAMLTSAFATSFMFLLLTRIFLGVVTATAGPSIASMVGDTFPAEIRGRVWGLILAGELIGAGFGFVVSGDLAAVSWRAGFVVLALPAAAVTWWLWRMPEPERGGTETLKGRRRRGKGAESVAQVNLDDDVHRLARESDVEPEEDLILTRDPRRMPLWTAVRYVLRVRTNVVLIIAGACGYFFFAGVRSFGIEFVKGQYGLAQATASTLTLVLGIGAISGVIMGGRIGDWLIARGWLSGRIGIAIVALLITTALFVPALLVTEVFIALPILVAATFALSSLNPPMDAARLDIMHPQLWGRAEAVRSVLRTAAEAAAPLLFGVFADHVFGGGHQGLQDAFLVMLFPLAASGLVLIPALRTYPRDVATATESIARTMRVTSPR